MTIFVAAYLPIIINDPKAILTQIGTRLFPFDRGLVHDYIAGNVWGLYVLIMKYPVNLYTRYTTGEKVPLNFKPDDLDYYKKISLVLTVASLMPIIIKMFVSKRFKADIRVFCDYLALVNFIAFNFGFHVHEKAILMTYLPLVLGRGTKDTLTSLLGLVMTWSFLPLIPPTRGIETFAKHMLLGMQMSIYWRCGRAVETANKEAVGNVNWADWTFKWFFRFMVLFIIAV